MKNTQIKYMKKTDYQKAFIDRIQINHYALIDSKFAKKIKKGKIYSKRLKTFIYLAQAKNNTTRITFTTQHNLNRLARIYYQKRYPQIKSRSIFSQRDNFIPANLLKHLKDEGITRKDIRKKAISLLFKEIKKTEKKALRAIWKDGAKKYRNLAFSHSVQQVEICIDLLKPAPIELCKSPQIKESLADSLQSLSQSKYIDNSNCTTFSSKIISAEDILDTGREIIKGSCHDQTTVKIYTKEITRKYAMTRLERVFSGRNQIIKYTGRTSFKSKKEFKRIFNILRRCTFDSFFNILNQPIDFNDQIVNDIISHNCKQYFRSHWEEAYKDLTTGDFTITTGINGKSIKPVQLIARKLANEKLFLKKSRRGRYKVDRHKIKGTIS